jgi:hypothetical protein
VAFKLILKRDLYSSPNIIKTIKPRGMRGARNMEQMGEKRNARMLFDKRARGKETTKKTRK